MCLLYVHMCQQTQSKPTNNCGVVYKYLYIVDPYVLEVVYVLHMICLSRIVLKFQSNFWELKMYVYAYVRTILYLLSL